MEPRLLQPVAVVDDRTLDLVHALGVHDEPDSVELVDHIGGIHRGVEFQLIAEPGAAPGTHPEAQRQTGVAFLGDQFGHLGHRRCGEGHLGLGTPGGDRNGLHTGSRSSERGQYTASGAANGSPLFAYPRGGA